MEYETTFSLPGIAKEFEVTLRPVTTRRFRIRLFIGILIIKLGAWICPVEVLES